jgi:hypothetical protein
MVKSEEELRWLPPPRPDDTHGNLQTKRVRVTDGRQRRPRKGLKQFAIKARARVLDIFTEAFEQMSAGDPSITRGDLLELMVASFVKTPSAARTARLAATPDPRDRTEGRVEHIDLFATPDLARALKARSAEKKWTLSATIENACTDAKDYAVLVKTPCPKCGKVRGD